MKNLLIFLDEVYYKEGEQFISKFNAGRFLQKLRSNFSLKFMFPISNEPPVNATTVIEESETIPLTNWNSLISYAKSYLIVNKIIKKKMQLILPKIDVIWIRMPSLPGLYIAKIAFKAKIPCVFHFAGDIRYGYQNEQYKGLQKIVALLTGYAIHYLMKRTVSKYKKLVYCLCTGSKMLKEFSCQRAQFFIDSELNCTHQPVGCTNKITKLLFVGRLLKSKGILNLLNALTKTNDIQINVIGYGPLEKKVQEFCLNYKQFHYAGYKTGKELEEIYSDSDILIMPSISSEGFPRVIVEAWSKGLAVISTDVGGIKGVGQHEKNILFVKPNEISELRAAIVRLVNDRSLLQELKKNGFDTSQKLTHSSMLSVAIESIKNMVNNEQL